MTRYESIKKMSKEDLARYMCDFFEECSVCPVESECRIGHNGFKNWLDEQVDGGESEEQLPGQMNISDYGI